MYPAVLCPGVAARAPVSREELYKEEDDEAPAAGGQG